ncbi:ABC transporter permease [Clostridium sp. 'White wine YQ']|uniref:ABC transporter permease n=1 Tax=Clostridium sp. 'White wine YQ' TaxID=3027474 RepID=UPI002366B7C4|nr:ABC transporter permease [Clostridium sp. 'White wine YQ']MDD7795915.1 ABC transporter permease [Clostridium sp. 'White wine YQ']
MRILKSIFKRKLTTTFFIIAYTLAILSFSIGNSVIEEQKLKAKYFNSDNNKILSFSDCNNYDLLKLEQLLKDDDISLEVSKGVKLNKSENFTLSTTFINKGLKPFVNMKSGSFFSKVDFESNSNKAIFSSTIDVSDNKYSFKTFNTKGDSKEFVLIESGITNEREQKIVVPKKVFLECVENINLSDNDLVIKINGEQTAITKALNKVEASIKEYSSNAKLTVSPYVVNDNSEEYQYLFKVSLVIIVIILLNSINISSLWLETRKREIVIRKVLGATNKNIFNILFSELTIISLMSMILALLVQTILYKVNNGSIFNVSIALYKSNFIYALLLSIVTAYISALPVYMYLLKIQPSQALAEE